MSDKQRHRRRRRGRFIRAHDHTFKKQDLPSSQESVQGHTNFILADWELAAAGSWRGYQQEGRGAIVIDLSAGPAQAGVAGVEESPPWAPVCVPPVCRACLRAPHRQAGTGRRTGRPRFVAGIDLAMTPGYYVADRQIQEIGIGWPIPEASRMVRQYHPEREVVFVFLREDGGVSSYRIQAPGAPAPPEAYAQYKDEL